VSTRVLDAIESGREQLVMPPLVRLVPGVRLLPTRAFDTVIDFLGVNQTMDHFTGRTRQPSGGS
jgi:all-trans-retinol dehydrogenase (NAD+)